jgi:hypothetical protein
MKSIAIFPILVAATLGLAVAVNAQTATITCTYDDLNRLTSVSYAGGVSNNQSGITQTFTPDEAGNITSSTVTTASVDSKGVNAVTWAFFGNTSTGNCGIPDAWAYTYGLDWYDPNLANESPENDGVTNLYAYQQSENPNNPNNPPPATAAPALSPAALILLVLLMAGLAVVKERGRS